MAVIATVMVILFFIALGCIYWGIKNDPQTWVSNRNKRKWPKA